MKKIILLSLFLLASHYLSAQTAIKLYQNLDHVRNNLEYGGHVKDAEVYFARTSLAIQFENRDDIFHEIEISYAQKAIPVVHLFFTQSEWTNITEDYVGIQYELNKIFGKGSTFRFSLGGGTLLYGLLTQHEPKVASVLKNEYRYIGSILNVVPRIQYNISRRLLADLNFKFQLFDVHYLGHRTNSPMLPISQQKEDSIETQFFPAAYNLRIGLGCKL